MSGSIIIFYGAVINPTSLTAYSTFPRSLIAVGPTGNIEWITEEVLPHQLQDELARRGCLSEDLVELKDGDFLIPGFIDTHTVLSSYSRPISDRCSTFLIIIARTSSSEYGNVSLLRDFAAWGLRD